MASQFKPTCKTYSITQFPTVLWFNNGAMQKYFIGKRERDVMADYVREHSLERRKTPPTFHDSHLNEL
jgi:hypothetical protein